MVARQFAARDLWGSLSALLLEFPDRAALNEYLAGEPYVAEGVWQKIVVEPMNVVLVNGEKRQ